MQQVVVNLCRTIDKSRFHITVLCLRGLGPLARDIERIGIEIILLPQKKTGLIPEAGLLYLIRCSGAGIAHPAYPRNFRGWRGVGRAPLWCPG